MLPNLGANPFCARFQLARSRQVGMTREDVVPHLLELSLEQAVSPSLCHSEPREESSEAQKKSTNAREYTRAPPARSLPLPKRDFVALVPHDDTVE